MAKKGRPIKEVPDWINYRAVLHWVKTNLTRSSAQSYLGRINKWMDFIEMSPTEQIEKRIKDLQSENPKERNFFEKLVMAHNSVTLQCKFLFQPV